MRLCARQPARATLCPVAAAPCFKGTRHPYLIPPRVEPGSRPDAARCTLHAARCTARLDVTCVRCSTHSTLTSADTLAQREGLWYTLCVRDTMRLTHPSFLPRVLRERFVGSRGRRASPCEAAARADTPHTAGWQVLSTSLWRTKMASSGLAQTQPGQTVAKLPSGPA